MEKTLADQATPYLYPCAIQFCLAALAVLVNLHWKVGTPIQPRLPTSKSSKLIGGLCHKSNTGLFFGLIVLVVTCISACFFLLYDNTGYPLTNHVSLLVYMGGDTTVTFAALIVVLLAFCRMQKLDKGNNGASTADKIFLFASLGGYLLLLIFIIIPTLMAVNFTDKQGIFAAAQVALSSVACIQALVQVMFILFGLRRTTTTRKQLKTKPGRSLVTFVLLCNLALWVVITFQLKEMHSSPIRTFYGELPWQIIMHITFPLAAFFRFYSSVSLADIWLKAYKRKRHNSQVFRGRHDSDRHAELSSVR